MIITRRPNGAGGIRKLSGRRRHPYQVVVTSGYHIINNVMKPRQISLGCYATRKEALEKLAEWQVSHLRVDLRYMTMQMVYNKIKPEFTESVAKQMETVYNRYKILKDTRIIDIKTHTIEDVAIPKLSAESHNAIRAFWHKIYQYGIENDILTKDYSQYLRFRETKEKQIKNILTPDEIRKVKMVRLYRILLYTGMRINELLTMESESVYEENGILCFHVLKAKTEAGKRIIPVHSAIMDDIVPYLSSGYIIPKTSYMTVNREFKKFIEKYNLSKHTLHDFRRTFASYAKTCGVEEYYRKALLGHTHGNVTDDVYTKAFVSDLFYQIEKIKL